MFKVSVLIFGLIYSFSSYALSFKLPKVGDDLIGRAKTTQVRDGENFSDIAIRFDVGYYEMLEANPGIDPDKPPTNTVLIVPTQYILPTNLQENKVLINLAEMRLYYKTKDRVYIFPVGIGKENWNTPVGEMRIVKKKENPTWHMPKSISDFRKARGDKKFKRVVPPGPENPLGKHAIYLSKIGYLIHGNNVAAGVGRRSTAGCIRLYNNDIKKLYSLVGVGTKVIITNQAYKAGWYGKKLYLEAHMPLFEERMRVGNDMKPVFDIVSTASKKGKGIVDWQKVEKVTKEHLAIPRVVS